MTFTAERASIVHSRRPTPGGAGQHFRAHPAGAGRRPTHLGHRTRDGGTDHHDNPPPATRPADRDGPAAVAAGPRRGRRPPTRPQRELPQPAMPTPTRPLPGATRRDTPPAGGLPPRHHANTSTRPTDRRQGPGRDRRVQPVAGSVPPNRPPTWPDRSAATATYPGRRAPCRLISAGKRNGWADPGTRAAGNPMAGGHPGLPPCWACRTPPPRRATCPSRGRSPPAAGGSGSCSSGDTSPNGTAAPDRGV